MSATVEVIWDKDNPHTVSLIAAEGKDPIFTATLSYDGAITLLEALSALLKDDKELIAELSDYTSPEYAIVGALGENCDVVEIINTVAGLGMSINFMSLYDDGFDSDLNDHYAMSTDPETGRVVAYS